MNVWMYTGEELDLMRSALKEVNGILRKETEEAYGTTIEEYLEVRKEKVGKEREMINAYVYSWLLTNWS